MTSRTPLDDMEDFCEAWCAVSDVYSRLKRLVSTHGERISDDMELINEMSTWLSNNRISPLEVRCYIRAIREHSNEIGIYEETIRQLMSKLPKIEE